LGGPFDAGGDRLINLVQTWLDLTQLEINPSLQVHREPTDLQKLITSVWESLEPLAQRQELSLSYSGPSDLVINVDPSRMYQVFLNLLDNSIKYSPTGGKISVDAKIILEKYNDSSTIEINIIDSGVGFSEADLPLVFERFYRGDQARTSRPIEDSVITSTKAIVGSGLGLSIVRQIILAHDATIKAMNHPETGGAWLQLHFPESMTKP
jgi:two-component system, OmpR family, phosphate regulon sensor histidine kinase PhoR